MIKYNSKFISKDIAVCLIDDTDQYDYWTRELVKNRGDYTITNCTGMGYDVFVGKNPDPMLRSISKKYRAAVVMSPGTEFLNGEDFLKSIPKKFNILAHILDAGEGYYMLHPQCYVINLEIFDRLGCPRIGEAKYFNSLTTEKPTRSCENIHDDYTPLYVKPGNITQTYKHTYNGWNLIRTFLENGFKIEAFDNHQRNSKHYLYRDELNSEWIYLRYNYCLTTHIYETNTGPNLLPEIDSAIGNIIVPAAGLNWFNTMQKYGTLKNSCVKFYDYNIKSLEWIKSNTQNIPEVKFEFHHVDILNQPDKFLDIVREDTDYIEFSNIFAYEATSALIPLKYRLKTQNYLIEKIQTINPNIKLHFDQKAEDGFARDTSRINQWEDLNLPAWHS